MEINVFKPATSKEGNSEVYIVCKYFSIRAISDDMREVLLNNVENLSGNPMFAKSDIPAEFIEQIRNCSKHFKDIQTKAILNNIQSYEINLDRGNWRTENPSLSNYQIRILRKRIADEFIYRYNIQPIRNGQRIVQNCTSSAQSYSDENRQEENKTSSIFPLGSIKYQHAWISRESIKHQSCRIILFS